MVLRASVTSWMMLASRVPTSLTSSDCRFAISGVMSERSLFLRPLTWDVVLVSALLIVVRYCWRVFWSRAEEPAPCLMAVTGPF